MRADPVPFEVYQHDMDQLGEQGSSIIQRLVDEKKNLERMIWLIVNAAGGQVKVHDADMARYQPSLCVLEKWRDDVEPGMTLITKQKF